MLLYNLYHISNTLYYYYYLYTNIMSIQLVIIIISILLVLCVFAIRAHSAGRDREQRDDIETRQQNSVVQERPTENRIINPELNQNRTGHQNY